MGSDFAGLPFSCITDKELCRERIISNFTPSYPHKYKEYNITKFLRRGTPMECHDVSLKARSAPPRTASSSQTTSCCSARAWRCWAPRSKPHTLTHSNNLTRCGGNSIRSRRTFVCALIFYAHQISMPAGHAPHLPRARVHAWLVQASRQPSTPRNRTV